MMGRVVDHRLTRDELSWLLAQEARVAAKALRQGVSQLDPNEPPRSSRRPLPPVHVTLDALDDAIDALSQLQDTPRTTVRKGRVDLAAVLLKVAPQARVAIAPGEGTEVFGDEEDLTRMLQVMLTQSSLGESLDTATPDIHLRRQGDFVKLSAPLGPDPSSTFQIERRWLNRMALRMGGQLELEGSDQALVLPADGASVRHEVDELRRELEQAKRLGEAYARELAQVFASGLPPPMPPPPPGTAGAARFDLLRSISAAMVRSLGPLLESMEGDLDRVRARFTENAPGLPGLNQRLVTLRELVGGLQRVVDTNPTAPSESVDAAKLLAEVVRGAERRAARHSILVELQVHPAASTETSVRGPVFALLVRSLVDHAIAATPRDSAVVVELAVDSGGATVAVTDGGPGVPPSAHGDLRRHRVDPTSLGRPAGAALLIADSAAALLGAELELTTAPEGGLRVQCRVVPSSA